MKNCMRFLPLSVALVATGCIFGTPGEVVDTPDVAEVDSGPDMATPDDVGPVPDMTTTPDAGPPPVDMAEEPDTGGGPDMPPTNRCTESAVRPRLYPNTDLLNGVEVTGDVSLTSFARPGGVGPGVALAFRVGDQARLYDLEANDGVDIVSTAVDPFPATDIALVRDVAVGQRGGGNFGYDTVISGNNCDPATNSGFLWISTVMNPVIPSGQCPSPIWGIDYAAGYRPFSNDGNGPHRAVYFERTGETTRLVSLSAPYRMQDYRGVPFDTPVDGGWVDGTGGDVVLLANGNQNLFVWDTTADTPPVPLGLNGTRVGTGFAALGGDFYVMARIAPADSNLIVSLYRWSAPALGEPELVEVGTVNDLLPGGNPTAANVAAFPGGFAVFVQDGQERWLVRTFTVQDAVAQSTGCFFELDGFSNVDTQDLQLVAYRDGDALQVLAAVLFNQGPSQYINVEGPRFPDFYR